MTTLCGRALYVSYTSKLDRLVWVAPRYFQAWQVSMGSSANSDDSNKLHPTRSPSRPCRPCRPCRPSRPCRSSHPSLGSPPRWPVLFTWTNYDSRRRGLVFSAFLPTQFFKNSARSWVLAFYMIWYVLRSFVKFRQIFKTTEFAKKWQSLHFKRN